MIAKGAQQTTELLDTEKELYKYLEQSQALKQQEIEQINEEIFRLKDEVDIVRKETEPKVKKNLQAARE